MSNVLNISEIIKRQAAVLDQFRSNFQYFKTLPSFGFDNETIFRLSVLVNFCGCTNYIVHFYGRIPEINNILVTNPNMKICIRQLLTKKLKK